MLFPFLYFLSSTDVFLTTLLLIHEADPIGWGWGVVCPLASEPIFELFSTDRSSTATDTESINNPKVDSFSTVDFWESSKNHGVWEVVHGHMQLVAVIGITAHTRVGVFVPRCLEGHDCRKVLRSRGSIQKLTASHIRRERCKGFCRLL